jgi:hypothetical protein
MTTVIPIHQISSQDPARRHVAAVTQVPLLSTIIASDAESVYDAIWGSKYRWFRVDDYKLVPGLQETSIDVRERMRCICL